MNDHLKNKRGLSLSIQILIGLILGFSVGLFLGEKASALAIVGKAYIGLIQMSILPYMVVSLMLGIGSLGFEKARKLAITGGIVLVASWLLAFIILFLMPLTFPTIEAGSFFSTSLVEIAEVDFIDLYIPINPFSSLARTVVPAAAVFSIVFGIALIGVENKKNLLDFLDTVSKTLTRMAMIVVKITPVGIFAIAAHATGTMTVQEFGRLQSYIIPFIVATLLLTFWLLPGLVAAITSFSYSEILKSARDALVTGFVTGNLFITLPMLVEHTKELFVNQRMANDETDSYVEVLVPTAFNFPNIGRVLTLLFVLFAGWFVGKNIVITDYPGFAVLGLFTMFGGVYVALPFLLDQMQIPKDMYQLYIVTGVLNNWFATLLAVMSLFSFTIVVTCAVTGALRLNWSRILRFAIISIVILFGAILGTRAVLSVMVTKEDIKRQTLMKAEIKDSHTIEINSNDLMEGVTQGSQIESIFKRGKLRVGYYHGKLPFSFYNDNGDLIGFDIELMRDLARGLGVQLEFIPWTHETLFKDLAHNKFDVAIGGLVVNLERLTKANFSKPYMDITMAVVVEDYQRHKFKTWRSIDEELIARLGVLGERRAKNVKRFLPNTNIVLLEDHREFFTTNPKGVHALIISAEAGSAWTIIYPSYSVVVPKPLMRSYAALAIPPGDPHFMDFINAWLEMKKTSGFINKLYDKWILGKTPKQKKRRWSIGRDILGLWE